ncbi:MAG: hypothetical protein WC823_00165 [Parcubacteria group bacterium]|jgi:hypothetical protein
MFRQYRQIEKGEFFVVAVDTCSGGGDFGPAQFLSKTKVDVPLVWHSDVTTSDFIPILVRTLEMIYDITGVKPVVALERQNGGAFLMDRLAAMNLLGKFILFIMPSIGNTEPGESKRLGWDTNLATRPKMLQDLQGAMNNTLIKIYDKQTLSECLSFVIVKNSSSWKAQAEKKSHDDLVMALAIAWQMYQICQPSVSEAKDYSKYENYKQEE